MKLWTEKASKESENQAPKSKSKEYIWSILHLSHGEKILFLQYYLLKESYGGSILINILV